MFICTKSFLYFNIAKLEYKLRNKLILLEMALKHRQSNFRKFSTYSLKTGLFLNLDHDSKCPSVLLMVRGDIH